MLKVVPAPTTGQGEGAPKRPHARTPLTDVEQMRLRAALRNLRALYGSWECLAEVMGLKKGTLKGIASGSNPASAGAAVRASRAAGVTIDRLLGGLAVAEKCPTCGRCS